MRTGDQLFLPEQGDGRCDERQHTVEPSNAPTLLRRDGSLVYIVADKSSSTPCWRCFRRRVRLREGTSSRMCTATATATDISPPVSPVTVSSPTTGVPFRRRLDRSDRGEQKVLMRMSGEPTHASVSSGAEVASLPAAIPLPPTRFVSIMPMLEADTGVPFEWSGQFLEVMEKEFCGWRGRRLAVAPNQD